MKKTSVRLEFTNDFVGTVHAEHGDIHINREGQAIMPYDMLLGALGSCFYSTFLDIARKMRLEYEKADIDIVGVKREETPTHLVTVDMLFTLYGVKDDKGFQRAAELAAKYCSIHHTLSQVADIQLLVGFKD
jgi:putative redox protein